MLGLNSPKWSFLLLLSIAAMVAAASAQRFKTLANFTGENGSAPFSPLVQGREGDLYGTTTQGGANSCIGQQGCGTVFKITSEGVLTTLYNFCAQPNCTDGATPAAGLLLGVDGNFYGTTVTGTVFKITPSGVLTVLYRFCTQPGCPDGNGINGLIQANDGNFYGTTYYGGAQPQGVCSPGGQPGCGTIFKLTPEGTLTTLYSFCGETNCADGSNPFANLVQGTDGDLYGLTTLGGTNCYPYGCGTVFKITLGGTLTTLHSFSGGDGSGPTGALMPSSDGNFYGTTNFGGNTSCSVPGGCGTVFKMTRSGTVSTIYNFCAQTNCIDGSGPNIGLAPLTEGTNQVLYGTTAGGGANDRGTVFMITPQGSLTTLHSFAANEGQDPWAGVIQATNGSFYGTTAFGGANNDGTVFNLSTGLKPFVAFVRSLGKVGSTVQILGQGFKGTSAVSFNRTPATFTVRSNTFLTATVPTGATTGFLTLITPGGTLTSNVVFRVEP
ncbi:MAG TPA: choice-of-anchor tandem repeat GloVer-containing protein [Terriglobales bacterium]|nr:choice-of-anchor tandem repeat GloVer-containing protein [Terriglobales bacterium]